MFFKKALFAICGISVATSAFASGFQISEYSAVNMGRSFAGTGVVGDDFSALGYNPAGMQYNQKNGAQVGAAAILLYSDYFDNDAHEGSSSEMGRVLPHVFAQYKVTEDLTLGAGIYTPYGLVTDYKNNWSGRYHGTLSELKAVDLSAGASYQVLPMLAVGASVNGQYADARLTSYGYHPLLGKEYAKDLQGKDIGAGYSLGLTLTPRKDLRFGVSYRSKVTHKLKGNIKLSGMGSFDGKYDVSARITTPELILISGAFDATKDLTLSASARWTKWSRFKSLNIIAQQNMPSGSKGTPISSTHENWKNTWFYAIGADYRINDAWTIRFGGAYDETAIKHEENRTVRIPDGRRLFASFGLTYRTGSWTWDAGYIHVWMRDGNAKGKDDADLTVTNANVHYYHAGAHMAGLSAQYEF